MPFHRDLLALSPRPAAWLTTTQIADVGQPELARERGLGHAGHADQRRAVAVHAVDLGRRFEPRPVHGAVDAAVDQRNPGSAAPPRGSVSRSAGV